MSDERWRGSEGESGEWRPACESAAVKKHASGQTGVVDELLASLHVGTYVVPEASRADGTTIGCGTRGAGGLHSNTGYSSLYAVLGTCGCSYAARLS